jgi:integrase
VALSRFTAEALAEHRKRMLAEGNYRADAPVFCNTQGTWMDLINLLNRHFRPILQRAGLPPVRLYDLRHTTATLLLLQGVNVKVVSERLGHSNITLTLSVYQHVIPGMQEQAASKIDQLLRSAESAENGYKLATN